MAANGGTSNGVWKNGTSRFSHLVKAGAAALNPRDLLQADVDQLLGVPPEMASILVNKMRIRTIFDLATSQVFNNALNLVDPQGYVAREYAKHGFVPADLLDDDPDGREDTQDVGSRGIERLSFRDKTTANKIKTCLNIENVRELALWPPFQTARGILNSTFGNGYEGMAQYRAPDPEQPQDLVPQSGNLATERAYYRSMFMLDHPQVEPVDSAVEDEDENALELKPLVGLELTAEQSWYTEGVTLG